MNSKTRTLIRDIQNNLQIIHENTPRAGRRIYLSENNPDIFPYPGADYTSNAGYRLIIAAVWVYRWLKLAFRRQRYYHARDSDRFCFLLVKEPETFPLSTQNIAMQYINDHFTYNARFLNDPDATNSPPSPLHKKSAAPS